MIREDIDVRVVQVPWGAEDVMSQTIEEASGQFLDQLDDDPESKTTLIARIAGVAPTTAALIVVIEVSRYIDDPPRVQIIPLPPGVRHVVTPEPSFE